MSEEDKTLLILFVFCFVLVPLICLGHFWAFAN